MTEEREKSRFFGGQDYLRRLDELLTGFNTMFAAGKPGAMYSFIVSYYQEIHSYMEKAEKEKHREREKELFRQYDKYQVEISKNAEAEQHNKRRPYERQYFSRKEKIRFTRELCAWRIELQDIAKRSGLVMAAREQDSMVDAT